MRKNKYATLVIFFVLMMKMVNQWHRRSLTYAFGLSMGLDFPEDQRAIYEISASYPQIQNWYPWLSGLIYSLPYSIAGILMGSYTHAVNRKKTMGIVMALAGLCQFLTGSINSFAALCVFRVIHGALNSCINPLSYSLVADYIPPDRRGTANSIIQSSIYIGVALSSLSILLIKSNGWRWAYQFMGLIGIAVGLGTLAFIKEPNFQ